MSLSEIKNLRKSRLKKVNDLKEQKEKLLKDDTYSEMHKIEQGKVFDQHIKEVSDEYEPQINELINERDKELRTGFHNAEYTELDEQSATVQLLKEMRVQQETSRLMIKYKGTNGDSFRDELKELVEVNSPLAQAHFNAIESLNINGVATMGLKEQYQEQNLNDVQKAYKSDLNNLEEQKAEFHTEVNGDPFQKKLDQYKD